MEGKKKTNSSYFQMPLHYPRYTKKDYEDMPEWKLDRLFSEYGLEVFGDVTYKREFAMGAFLWPGVAEAPHHTAKSSSLEALLKKKV